MIDHYVKIKETYSAALRGPMSLNVRGLWKIVLHFICVAYQGIVFELEHEVKIAVSFGSCQGG